MTSLINGNVPLAAAAATAQDRTGEGGQPREAERALLGKEPAVDSQVMGPQQQAEELAATSFKVTGAETAALEEVAGLS